MTEKHHSLFRPATAYIILLKPMTKQKKVAVEKKQMGKIHLPCSEEYQTNLSVPGLN